MFSNCQIKASHFEYFLIERPLSLLIEITTHQLNAKRNAPLHGELASTSFIKD
jgi:hypothetical protein